MYNPYQMGYQGYRQNQYCDDLKIVNGRNSAEQYTMMPNSRVILMDSSDDIFYLKETDASGVSRIRTYKFEEVPDIQYQPQGNYITMEQLEEVLSKYEFNSRETQQQPKSDNKRNEPTAATKF